MAFCIACGKENIPQAAFCVACGKAIVTEPLKPAEPVPSTPPAPPSVDEVVTPQQVVPAAVVEATAEEANPLPPTDVGRRARRPLFRRPLSRDWVFWLFVVAAGVGGLQSVYRAGKGYAYSSLALTLSGGVIDIAVSLLGGFVVFALIPASIRKLVFLPRDRKALRTVPADPSAGWGPDPLRLEEQRWWGGTGWTDATIPASGSKVGATAFWVVGALLAATTIAFMSGRGAGPLDASSSGDNMGSETSNASLMVAASFQGLTESLQEYVGIKIDPNAPMANIQQVKSAFDKVDTNYTELSGSLPSITNQSELGPSAPDLIKLREFVAAMGPYIQTRKDYYAGLEACGPITGTRQPTDCDVAAFDKWEKPMVDSIQPVATAWDAVIASMPKNQSQ